ncbi:MAG TPA: NrsF family protein [Kofleriaceae bacterium]|nr:NrsF family protein [Kofleriaceae bacterium]
MTDDLDALAAMPPPAPPAIGAALEAELGAIAPVKTRRPVRQLAILVALSLLYGAGLLVVLTLRRDMLELPMGWLVGVALGWLFGFLIPSYLALIPRPGSVTPRWKLAAVAAVIAAVGFVTLGLSVHPMGPSTGSLGAERFLRGHTCLEIGLTTALVPVVIGALFLRGALPVGSRWIAAALGAGGGCLGGLVLHLYCHIGDGLHIGLMHGGVVIVAALLSAAIVPRTTTPR